MTQKTVTTTDCEIKMNKLENVIKKYFWIAVITLVGILGSSFTFYYQQQEKKINKIATASIKSDERLEKRIQTQETRQIQVEKAQAAMGAKIETNMKWLMDACSRIETKQTRIEARLERTP